MNISTSVTVSEKSIPVVANISEILISDLNNVLFASKELGCQWQSHNSGTKSDWNVKCHGMLLLYILQYMSNVLCQGFPYLRKVKIHSVQ